MGEHARYVIIGNGVAGTTAAETLRKGDPAARVVLLGDEAYPLYNRVALPPLLKDEVPESKVLMRTVQAHREAGIELYLETRVERVDSGEKVVYTADGRAFPYDKLLLATGGRPRPLRVPGAEGTAHIYNFQTLNDAKAIRSRLQQARCAVTVGGSYIAYELTEAFRCQGLEVVWVMRGPWFLRRVLDEEGGALVDGIARQHGVHMVYGQEIAEVKAESGVVKGVCTTGGQYFPADVVGVGLGLNLNVELARGAGAEIGHGVVTDAFLQTSVPGIFAAGDVAEFYDSFLSRHHTMGTWNNAASHGKVAATNMLGGREAYTSVPTYTTSLFDSRIAVMGATPETQSGLEAHTRVEWAAQTYQRLFIWEGKLVGAVLIGDLGPRRRLLQAIRSGERVAAAELLRG